jgi:serine protease Do
VIGINSQIYSRTGGFMGISFAIPIDEAMRVADQLKATGKVTRGRIAWRSARSRRTWPIRSACRGRRAGEQRRAGRPGRQGGHPAGRHHPEVQRPFGRRGVGPAAHGRRHEAGAKATVTVAQGPARELPITIAETPAETTAKAEQRKSAPQKPRQANSLGLTVSDIPAEQMKSLKLKNGVQIDGVDGPAARRAAARRHRAARRRHRHHEREAVRRRDRAARSAEGGRGARAARRQHAVRAGASAPEPEASRAPMFTLYGRGWCHLCDDMRDALAPLAAE